MTKIFLDTETGGLDDSQQPLLEAAWAVDDGPIRTLRFPHDVRDCDEVALQINGYDARMLWDRRSWGNVVDEVALWSALKHGTLVMSNPSHDERFLLAYARSRPHLHALGGPLPGATWPHRKIDIASYAMPLLGYDTPKGLAKICEDLRDLGHDVPAPDHGAYNDVLSLRAAFRALEQMWVR